MMSQNFDSDGILPACEWRFYSCPGSTSSEGFAPGREAEHGRACRKFLAPQLRVTLQKLAVQDSPAKGTAEGC